MREKTQCPNCGSYYTQITRWYGDPITRTRFSDPERWWNKYLLRYRIDSSMGDVETLLRGGGPGSQGAPSDEDGFPGASEWRRLSLQLLRIPMALDSRYG